jgi:cullin 1
MCGYEYVAKLQRMYKDKIISHDINEAFRKRIENSAQPMPHEFDVMVMSTNAWPFNTARPFNLPADMQASQQRFTDFYTEKYTGRRLNYLYQMSRGELLINGLDKKYTIIATTQQMAVLLQVRARALH